MLAAFRQPADLICMRCLGQSFRENLAWNKLQPQKNCAVMCLCVITD